MPRTTMGKVIVFGTIAVVGFFVLVAIFASSENDRDRTDAAQEAATRTSTSTSASSNSRVNSTTATSSTTRSAPSTSSAGSSRASTATSAGTSSRASSTTATSSTTRSGSSGSSAGSSQTSGATSASTTSGSTASASGRSSARSTANATASANRSSASGAGSASVVLSGRGDGVKAVTLGEGVWFCDVSVSGNGGAYGPGNFIVEFTGRNGGYDLLANEIETSWSARKRVEVGGGIFDFGPGTIDVEIQADGTWRIACEAQTAGASGSEQRTRSAPASSSRSGGVRLSGRGAGVNSVDLTEGVWFCDVSVSGNSGAYGASNFIVELTGRNGGYDILANEIERQWSGTRRVSVGDGLFDFGEGTVDVEVTAVGSWEMDCEKQ